LSATTFDPAHVLGCTPEEAAVLLRGRRVTPGEVESLAIRHYSWRRHLNDAHSYWVTVSQAARILRMSPQRVKRLLEDGQLRHVTHVSGVRLMRRRDIESVADRGRSTRPAQRRR
jgi:hypothetical protein